MAHGLRMTIRTPQSPGVKAGPGAASDLPPQAPSQAVTTITGGCPFPTRSRRASDAETAAPADRGGPGTSQQRHATATCPFATARPRIVATYEANGEWFSSDTPSPEWAPKMPLCAAWRRATNHRVVAPRWRLRGLRSTMRGSRRAMRASQSWRAIELRNWRRAIQPSTGRN
jgi:hypothetical protein